jgi:hypothetical protein
MSETTPDTDTHCIARNPQREPHPHGAEHAAGTTTRPLSPTRSHHRGNNPSRRLPVSQEQHQKLSAAQREYVATDPRWAAHRQKLAEAQLARRMTLTPDEFDMVVKMRAKGRTFSYIEAEIGVCHDVICRVQPALPTVAGAAGLKHLPHPHRPCRSLLLAPPPLGIPPGRARAWLLACGAERNRKAA